MKARKPRRCIIVDPIFGFTIYMQLFGDCTSFREWFDKKANCINFNDKPAYGLFSWDTSHPRTIGIFSELDNAQIMTHEVIHLVSHVRNELGISDKNNNEFASCYGEYVTDYFMKLRNRK